jgi:hypothetical protein
LIPRSRRYRHGEEGHVGRRHHGKVWLLPRLNVSTCAE